MSTKAAGDGVRGHGESEVGPYMSEEVLCFFMLRGETFLQRLRPWCSWRSHYSSVVCHSPNFTNDYFIVYFPYSLRLAFPCCDLPCPASFSAHYAFYGKSQKLPQILGKLPSLPHVPVLCLLSLRRKWLCSLPGLAFHLCVSLHPPHRGDGAPAQLPSSFWIILSGFSLWLGWEAGGAKPQGDLSEGDGAIEGWDLCWHEFG